jgi:hypothetical protein
MHLASSLPRTEGLMQWSKERSTFDLRPKSVSELCRVSGASSVEEWLAPARPFAPGAARSRTAPAVSFSALSFGPMF